jgi:hypothetical protein
VGRISAWRATNGKSTSGADNDATVTSLTGGSGEYISFVLKQTNGEAKTGGDHAPAPLMAAQQDDDNKTQMIAQTGSISNLISEFY